MRVMTFKFSKKILIRWYYLWHGISSLLITKKFLFWDFWKWKVGFFFEPKGWSKYGICWLLKSSCFKLFGDGKYSILLIQKVDGKMMFPDYLKFHVLSFSEIRNMAFFEPKSWWKMICTNYWKLLVLIFSVMGNTVFFSAKKLIERWYLLGLFELSMIFQDLQNMVFRGVLYVNDNSNAI